MMVGRKLQHLPTHQEGPLWDPPKPGHLSLVIICCFFHRFAGGDGPREPQVRPGWADPAADEGIRDPGQTCQLHG